MYTDQLQRYDAVENGLCFGRLDITDGEPPLHRAASACFDDDGDTSRC